MLRHRSNLGREASVHCTSKMINVRANVEFATINMFDCFARHHGHSKVWNQALKAVIPALHPLFLSEPRAQNVY